MCVYFLRSLLLCPLLALIGLRGDACIACKTYTGTPNDSSTATNYNVYLSYLLNCFGPGFLGFVSASLLATFLNLIFYWSLHGW